MLTPCHLEDRVLTAEPATSPERWRQKYYDSLAELEEKEREWREADSLLRRSLSRITLVADGRDTELDGHLERLRNVIRDERDNARIQRLVNAIAESAANLERTQPQAAATPSAAEVISALLADLELPRGVRGAQKKLRKRLDGDNFATPREAIAEFVALLSRSLQLAAQESESESETPSSSGGIMGRLFGSRDAPDDNNDEVAQEAVVSPHTDVAAGTFFLELLQSLELPADADTEINVFKKRLARAEEAAELHALTQQLAALLNTGFASKTPHDVAVIELTPEEVLLDLLNTLSLPEELHARAGTIKARLQRPLTREAAPEVLTAIAELVSAMRARAQAERRDIERFLSQLSSHLTEVDAHLRSSAARGADDLQRDRQLHDQVGAQVADIETGMARAADLDVLKTLVRERVEAIRDHMTAHHEELEVRYEESQRAIESLTGQVAKMEAQTGQLRESVEEAQQRALRDALTQLPNRLAYDERIEQEVARWRRFGAPLSLIVWDIDHFKNINDTYGHAAGDKVLAAVAKLLVRQQRETDFTARFGGEEFVTLLPGTGAGEALPLAEKVRASVEASRFRSQEKLVPVTISCGITEFAGDDEPAQVFQRADRALYQAKADGRNRCHVEKLAPLPAAADA